MKKLFFITALIAFFSSCNNAPEPYKNAQKQIISGNYEKAIFLLNKVTDENEDDEWVDSAFVKKNEAFDKLLRTNDWERISMVIEEESENRKFKKEMKKIIYRYAKESIDAGNIDTTIYTLAENEKTLISFLDTSSITKVVDLIKLKVLNGKWSIVKNKLKGHEIYFVNNGDLIEGKSVKSIAGWSKDKVMYKVGKYCYGLKWKCETRIFHSYVYTYYNDYESFGKKGTLKIFNIDSIYIDYGQSGLNATFIRLK